MFADVEADIYVMADGDATYDAAAAPAMVAQLIDEQLDMVVGTRSHEVEEAYRRGHVLGNRAADRACSRGCSGAASPTSSRATASSRAASSRASRRCRAGSRSRPRSASTRSNCAMPVGEVETRLWRAARRIGVEALAPIATAGASCETILHALPDRAAGAVLRQRSARCSRCSRSSSAIPLVDHLFPDRPGAALPDRDPGRPG